MGDGVTGSRLDAAERCIAGTRELSDFDTDDLQGITMILTHLRALAYEQQRLNDRMQVEVEREFCLRAI